MTDDLERRLRDVEQELAALRGWREAVSMRDDKAHAWWPVGVAIAAIVISAILPLLLGGSP